MTMRTSLIKRAALAAVVLGGFGALPQSAPAAVTVGIGQQTPEMFSSPYWKQLHAAHVRYITPWDTLSDPAQLARLDAWMASAQGAGVDVMLGFSHSLRNDRLARVLPTTVQFSHAFRGLRERYPRVRDWVPWNETNHPTALTGNRPGRAAEYYNIVTRLCQGCNVVAADVLDIGNVAGWIQRFLRSVHTSPRIWGLHNYHDANSLTSAGTRTMLRLVKGQIWFTETGGVVKMRVPRRGHLTTTNYGLQHAARATRHVLDLARLSPRIQRIYLYHWTAPSRFTTWDSAIMDPRMRPRPAYRALRTWLVNARRSGLASAR
jgi:hypothetical protein